MQECYGDSTHKVYGGLSSITIQGMTQKYYMHNKTMAIIYFKIYTLSK